MGTLLYFIVSFLFAMGYILLFNVTELILINVLFWALFFVLGLLSAFVIFLLIFSLIGYSIRSIDAHNMKRHRFVNWVLRIAFNLLNVKLVVTGKENIPKKGEKFIFVCNHQENYDIMAIKPVLKDHPLNFIAKKEVFSWPVLGHWIKVLGNIPIAREADRSAAESIVKGIKLYQSGIPMAIFPEGKRTFSNTMTQFKPGAFKLATKPKADILVGTIYDFPMVFKGWPIIRQKIYLHFHPLLTHDTYQDMNTIQLSDYVKRMIQNKLDDYEKTLKS